MQISSLSALSASSSLFGPGTGQQNRSQGAGQILPNSAKASASAGNKVFSLPRHSLTAAAAPQASAARTQLTSAQATAAYQSAMNMIAAIGAYAAISRQLGLPLVYPGSGTRVTEATDARLLARAIAWSGRTPAAANQIFNVANGDVFIWENGIVTLPTKSASGL